MVMAVVLQPAADPVTPVRTSGGTPYDTMVSSPQVYWKHGNGVSFLQLVQNMTGAPLAGDSWVAELRQPLEDRVTSEKTAFEKGLEVILCLVRSCHQAIRFPRQSL